MLFGYTYTTQEGAMKKSLKHECFKSELEERSPLPHWFNFIEGTLSGTKCPDIPPFPYKFNLIDMDLVLGFPLGTASNKFRVFTDSNSNPKFNDTSDSYQLPHSSYHEGPHMHHKLTSKWSYSHSGSLFKPRCPDSGSNPCLALKEWRSFEWITSPRWQFLGYAQTCETFTSK